MRCVPPTLDPSIPRSLDPCRRRRAAGLILPVVLVLIALLALTMAGFLFFVRAETSGILAVNDGQQARLAAESGLQELIAVLRKDRDNVKAWYDAPDVFRHGLVWAREYDRQSDPVKEFGTRKEAFNRNVPTPAWRFSIVASRPDGPENTMRFGITPESAKLNINVATEAQLQQLIEPILLNLQIENPQEIINAILDWRDADLEVREGGAENEFYNELEPPYNTKNGRLDTVEELLLVKGVSAAILYGEDVNRNGILDENEDDGEETFPFYDNADGILDVGIAPFLTVWTREVDTSLDNKPRINLNTDAGTISGQIAEYFQSDEEEDLEAEEEPEQLSDATIQFIMNLKSQNFDFAQLPSPAELCVCGEENFGMPPEEGDPNTGDPNSGDPQPSGGIDPQILQALAASPITLEEMPIIMDRFSTRSTQAARQPIENLININAAPARVLMLIPNMTAEAANAILAARQELDAATLRTTAWPLMTETLDARTFKNIAPYITTKSHQFHVEVLGYADHLRASQRLEWIIEMIGPLAQVKYHRDLSRLGPAWPIDDETVVVTE